MPKDAKTGTAELVAVPTATLIALLDIAGRHVAFMPSGPDYLAAREHIVEGNVSLRYPRFVHADLRGAFLVGFKLAAVWAGIPRPMRKSAGEFAWQHYVVRRAA